MPLETPVALFTLKDVNRHAFNLIFLNFYSPNLDMLAGTYEICTFNVQADAS